MKPAASKKTGRGALRPFFVCALAGSLLGCSGTGAIGAHEIPPPLAGEVGPPARMAAPAATPAAPEAARGGRIMPPSALSCDRNQLTSYRGVVSAYRRGPEQTFLRIDTDEATVEEVTIDHAGQPDASARYLLWGQPFTAQDFSRIERADGGLLDGMRAVAWMCDDGRTAPVVDWQPPLQ